jgi:hypothetical protein
MNIQIRRIVFLLLVVTGCSSTQGASTVVKSGAISATQGGTLTVTAQDSASLAGTTVVIPPNALPQDTIITIGKGPATLAPAGTTSVGPVVALGPSGIVFNSQAAVTLPYAASRVTAPASLFVMAMEANGTTHRIENANLQISSVGGTLSFQVLGFTDFEVETVDPCNEATCTCDIGYTSCLSPADGGLYPVCVDLQTDYGNCGSCGTFCSGDELCMNGACLCGVGQAVVCPVDGDAGVCADLSSERLNCGACGIECETSCFNGSCTPVDAG